jgi:hypothetical protein
VVSASSLLFGLLVAATATEAAPAPSHGHQLSVALGQLRWPSYLRRVPDQLALELAYDWSDPHGLPGWLVGGGARLARGRADVPLPGELFVRARLEAGPGLDPWRPALGPELGVSGLGAPQPEPYVAAELHRRELGRVSPLYLAMHAAPARFRFGPLTLSALELSIGAGLFPLGGSVRWEVGLARVGWSL